MSDPVSPVSSTTKSPPATASAAVEGKARSWLIFGIVGLFAAIVFGLIYLFVIAPAVPEGGQGYSLGWFLFSFAAGLTMIVLPCTLPLAFVIVPLSMGKGLVKGIGMALSFGAGVAATLSLYGIVFAFVGGVVIDQTGADLEIVKNWVYFGAGIFALTFALAEIGLLKFRMPTYSGAAPAFIQKRGEFIKAFLLGLFLGNIGVGCPHPATPLILIEIATTGDVLYGWLMFLVHAIGRVLPLLLLSFLAILGVNGLNWLMARKESIERSTGWAMVFVAGFILTLGLFSHDWWVNSGLHSGLETLTQEAYFNELLNDTLDQEVAHVHGLEEGEGLFGLPLEWGSWVLVSLWLIPMFLWYRKRKKEVLASGDECEEKLLSTKRNFLIVIAIFIVVVFTQFLPDNFYLKSISGVGHGGDAHMNDDGHAHDEGVADDHAHMDMGEPVNDMKMMMGTPFLSSTEGLPDAQDSQFVELKDGDTYSITAGYVKKEVGNRTLRMLAYNGSVPGPFIKAPQGAEVTINFTNNTDLDQTIHSHGLRLDNASDGVPGVTQDAVLPGESFTYTIRFDDAGVYWYHPHTRDDYGQEMGLYGNYIVDPTEGYVSEVNREMPLVIDDILIVDEKIADFYREYTDYALLGRFGNEFLVNGEQDYVTNLQAGEVVRLFVTDVSNARTYNLSIPGVPIKLVGADVGQFEREVFVEDFLISPAERMIVEAYFEEPGTYKLMHTMPSGQIELATFAVSDTAVETSYADQFAELNTNQSVVDEFSTFRNYSSTEPDKNLLLTVKLMGMVDHSAHTGHAHNSEGVPTQDLSGIHAMPDGTIMNGAGEVIPGAHVMPDGTIMLADGSTPSLDENSNSNEGIDSIQWEDPAQSDAVNMTHNVEWMLVDQDTGKVSMNINDWTFTQGDLVKVRITNDEKADHQMQHPIHLHGQRFVVLSENGVPNTNMAWKDTSLVLPGEYIDILVEMSNTGEWMAHCHISEHLHAGMMLQFRVEDENGYAAGDEFRATVSPSMNQHGSMMDSSNPNPMQQNAVTTQSTYMYSDIEKADSTYNVVTTARFERVGRLAQIPLSFYDNNGNQVNLSDSADPALTVTFVNSNNTVSFVTYPGNTVFPAVQQDVNVPGTPGFDESMPHSHSFLGIPVAYAHGEVVDDGHHTGDYGGGVHYEAVGRTYTVPAQFPERGVYRGFAEFVLSGEETPRVSYFEIEVTEGFSVDDYGWSKEMKWWILLIGSLMFMVPLVYYVRKYIAVDKPVKT